VRFGGLFTAWVCFLFFIFYFYFISEDSRPRATAYNPFQHTIVPTTAQHNRHDQQLAAAAAAGRPAVGGPSGSEHGCPSGTAKPSCRKDP
jgi:hypothetical protein